MIINKIVKKLLYIVGVILFLLLLLFLGNNIICRTDYDIESSKIPEEFDGFRILQVSDLHSKVFWSDNSYLKNKIDGSNPDIVVFTGDMIGTMDENWDDALELMSYVGGKYESYYIVGNHEQNLLEELDNWLAEVDKTGVKALMNEQADIERNGSKIRLCGLYFHLMYYKDVNDESLADIMFTEEKMEKLLGTKEDGVYTVVLAHNPVYFETYAEWGADLVLSGHMHGGVIILPFAGGMLSPEKEFFPEYYGGRFTEGGSEMIVNRGLSKGAGIPRVFNLPELTLIELKRAG